MSDLRLRRQAELNRLRHSRPEEIIELYRKLPAETRSWRNPPEISFSKMIEALLDYEEAADKLSQARSGMS